MATRRPGGAYVRLWTTAELRPKALYISRNEMRRQQNLLKTRLNQESRNSTSIRLWSSCLSREYLYSRMSCSIELGNIIFTQNAQT